MTSLRQNMIIPRSWHHSMKDYANYSEKNRQHHTMSVLTATTSKQQSYYHMKQLSRNRKLPHSNNTHSPPTKSLAKQSLAKTVFDKFRQNNWSKWLPLIQYQTNGMLPSITEETPHKSWIGFAPHARKTEKSDPLPEIDKQKEDLLCTRFQTQRAMRRTR